MFATRTVKQMAKLTLPARKAALSPPVGPRVGQVSVNIMGFSKDFNAATAAFEPGTPITTSIVAYSDRSADFKIRTPPTSYLLKRALVLRRAGRIFPEKVRYELDCEFGVVVEIGDGRRTTK